MTDSLNYKGYSATIRYSAADDVFFGTLTGINDLVTFEGTSVSELKSAFHEAVEDYLQTCKVVGKLPDKTYKGAFNIRVPAALHKKAATFALQHHITLNDFVKTALAYAVEHQIDISKGPAGAESLNI